MAWDAKFIGGPFDDLYYFDIPAETWSLAGTTGTPSARFKHSATLVDPLPLMWVFGGTDSSSILVNTAIERFRCVRCVG